LQKNGWLLSADEMSKPKQIDVSHNNPSIKGKSLCINRCCIFAVLDKTRRLAFHHRIYSNGTETKIIHLSIKHFTVVATDLQAYGSSPKQTPTDPKPHHPFETKFMILIPIEVRIIGQSSFQADRQRSAQHLPFLGR
jgi:hypothetical protein